MSQPSANPDETFRFVDLRRSAGEEEGDVLNALDALRAGLLAEPAAIAPKYFYDALGSHLFAAICHLPEYPLTRSEARLFAQHGARIAEAVGAGCVLIDLGAGDCAKAERLFPRLSPAAYLALDISADFLRQALAALRLRQPRLPITGVAVDFTQGVSLPETLLAPAQAPRLWFYPGSSIGNFTPPAAREFLASIARACTAAPAGGKLLIGVDLVRDRVRLEAAYDDALGVTAAFNRNVLRHVNHLLGSDFDVADWRHVAFYNDAEARIEMHLEARRDLVVRLGTTPGPTLRHFARGERIHTEHSHKWSEARFAALLAEAGFARQQSWHDAQDGFALFLAEVK